jgi:hypothetical protein
MASRAVSPAAAMITIAATSWRHREVAGMVTD